MRLRKRWVMVGLVVALLLTPTSAVFAQGGTITHIVAPGENLYRVSVRYGVNLRALMQVNGLPNPNVVYVGQRLVIPAQNSAPNPAVPVTPPPAAPQGPTVQEGATVHTVAPGENLYRISLRYGVSFQAMAWANGLSNPNVVYVGQRLMIPSRTGTTPPPALVPQPGPGAPPLSSGGAGKEIVVVLSQQRVYAYQDSKLIHSALASTGVARTPTRVGRYRIYTKYISTLMTGPGYYLPNVPYTMYYSSGYALHGTYWHNNFGRPMSHGCVNLPTGEARWFFEWAPVGTPVIVKW